MGTDSRLWLSVRDLMDDRTFTFREVDFFSDFTLVI